MAKKSEVELDAGKAATGYFTPTDQAFVGENKARLWSDAPEQLSIDIVALGTDAMEYWNYRSTNKTFRVEFERRFKLELRKFYNDLPDVRNAHSIQDVKWQIEYAITAGDEAAKKLAEKLTGDDAAHALDPSTATTKRFAERGQSSASATSASGVPAATSSTARRAISHPTPLPRAQGTRITAAPASLFSASVIPTSFR